MPDNDEIIDQAGTPLYVITGGRTKPRDSTLNIATLIRAQPLSGTTDIEPEYRLIVELCDRWLSVGEVSARLDLPLTVAKIQVDELITRGHLIAGERVTTDRPDRALLDEVLVGLKNL